MSADVGQAFQPAGSADFPVRRDARLCGTLGMSMMFWGLTVPGTATLDSLPYELKASLRYECPPLRIAPALALGFSCANVRLLWAVLNASKPRAVR